MDFPEFIHVDSSRVPGTAPTKIGQKNKQNTYVKSLLTETIEQVDATTMLVSISCL